jgi:hypothetical protein
MIKFSLICDNGHGFESWFRDNASFDTQVKRGFVTCPHCASIKVGKAIMAPRIARTDKGEAPSTQAPAAMAAISPEQQQMREMLRALRKHVEANADHVGDRFADEARKMHYGEIEHRSIYGSATPDEVRELRDEGVEAHPLPMVPDADA